MRKVLFLITTLFWAGTLSAQTTIPPLTQTVSGLLTSSSTSLTVAPQTVPSFTIQLSGTWTGTVTFEGSTDDTTYVSVLATSVTDGSTSTTATANGAWVIANGGYSSVRPRFSTATSGSVVANIRPGYAQVKLASPIYGVTAANTYCLSATTKDSYFQEVGANNPGAYTNGTNCAAGTLRFDWNSTRALFAVPIYLQDGTAAVPPLTFATQTNKGLYNVATDYLGFAANGLGIAAINYDSASVLGFRVRSDAQIGFSSTTAVTASSDVILSRGAANTLDLKNSTNLQTFRVFDATGAAFASISGTTITTPVGALGSAPLVITNGTNLTTATANAVENDGVSNYFTHDTTNGRKVDDEWNFFALTGNGTGITTIADFFGATGSGIPLVANGRYEIEWHCVFTQATAGTATWTIVTATTALAILDAGYRGTAIGGGGTVGTAQTAHVNTTASSSTALAVTGTEADAVTHAFDIHAIVTAGNGASNTRLRLAMSAGTATPKAGSYFKVRRLPAGNTGTFAT